LAAASGVAWTTISQFENGRGIRKATADKILAAFDRQGVEIVATEEKTGATIQMKRAQND
jgi:DNA-binding LacI/PurR family transcriptional regulator